jgi:hypothetical protein
MNPPDFLRLLEAHLQPMRVPFSRAALIAFTEGAFPLIEDHPDPDYWASRFLELGSAVEVQA